MKLKFLIWPITLGCIIGIGYSFWIQPEPQLSLDASTDKHSYLELERMDLTLLIDSNAKLDVQLKITGIQTRFGSYYINTEYQLSLDPGRNQLQLSYQIPACTACSGVEPGLHQIWIQLYSQDKLLAARVLQIQIQRR